MGEARVERRLAAIMMADVAGYGRLLEANEEGTIESLRQHVREFIAPVISRYGKRTFKDMGESFLVEFSSALEAMQCAVDIQRGMLERNAAVPEDRQIRFRIGINLGDVMVDNGDVYGDDVNIAARLMGFVQPGKIACSSGIRHQVGNRLGLSFLDQGQKTLKNIVMPIQVFVVGLDTAPSAGETNKAVTGFPRGHLEKPSVAVLPFLNMSGDPEQEYFSDGITEDIIIDLSKVSDLFVLSRNAVFRHKASAQDLDQIATDLGVGYLVSGSVRKHGSKVRITAQLIDGASGGHLWAERYDRNLIDIFELQDEIAKAVVEQLKVRLLPSERQSIEQVSTSSVEAYTYYLKGRGHFHRGSKTHYLLAKQMFAKAIELDPSFARAYAGLADCDAFLYMDYSVDVMDQVLSNSEKALALEHELVEACASRGLALSSAQRYQEAESEFERALKLNPNHFELRFFYGRSCYDQGKLEQASFHWERAAEIKPEDYQSLILLSQVYISLGRPDDATRVSHRGIERAQQEFVRNMDNPRPAYFIATTLAKLGEIKQAEPWANTALAIAPDDYLTQYNIACFHSVCGNSDLAFDLLLKLLPISNVEMKRWILTDSDLDPLHGDPRWQAVIRQASSN